MKPPPPLPGDERLKTQEPSGFPEPGDLFEERYRIDALIGTGGFAKVYRATQTDLGRDVALKIMLPEETLTKMLDDSGSSDGHRLAERFLQEARVVAKLRDPHTVTMHDHGRTKDGLLYMVFEHIDGVPLSRLVRAKGAIDPRRVSKILRQALSSLQEAHAMGMLHRDIKPGNIMIYEHVGRPDQVKVLDFGIAKLVGRQSVKEDLRDDLTTNGALLGTPRYMSPEQIRGLELTPASDIYSLGLVAYEMIMGKKAIDSNSSVMVIGAQLDPRSFEVPQRPNIPEPLRAVINRMLKKDRDRRFQTIDDVLGALEQIETGVFPAASVGPSSGVFDVSSDSFPDLSDSLEPLQVQAAEDEHARREGSRKDLVIAILALCIIIGVGAGMLVLKANDDTAAPQVTAPTEAQKPPTEAPVLEPPPVEPSAAPVVAAVEEDTAPRRMEITTKPPGLSVFVNDRSLGASPVSLSISGLQFPAKIRAAMPNGQSRMTLIDGPMDSVELDLSMFVTEEPSDSEAQKAAVAKPKPKAKPRPRQRKTQRQQTKPTPEPQKEGGSGLRLPALD